MCETTPDESSAAEPQQTGSSRFHPIHAIYAVALLASALAVFATVPMPRCRWEYVLPVWLAFGSKGVVPALLVLAVWGFVFYRKNRLLALAQLIFGFFVVYCLIICFKPPMNVAREAARRNECTNNMKNIGLALRDYHEPRQQFFLPPTATQSSGWSDCGTRR